MPIPNYSFWPTVLSYLSLNEQFKASALIEDQCPLHEKQAISPEELYFADITKSTTNIFGVFRSRSKPSANYCFKLHISISPADYNLVLFQSSLNQLLQKSMGSPAANKTLSAFKYVDPLLIARTKKNNSINEKLVSDFFQLLVDHHKLIEKDETTQKEQLHTLICQKYAAFIKAWGPNSFVKLDTLLEAAPDQLISLKQKTQHFMQESIASIQRFENAVQYSLYTLRE